jgi:hypothetical protein
VSGSSLLLSPFLISPSPSTYFFLVFCVFFRCFSATCSNSDHFCSPSKVLCCPSPLFSPPRANAGQCPSSPPLRLLLFFMVIFLILFILNKDRFGSRKSKYSLLRNKYILFWLSFSMAARFSLFFVFCNFT